MLQSPLGAYTIFHWMFMDAKIHNGENEMEFKLQKLTAELYDGSNQWIPRQRKTAAFTGRRMKHQKFLSFIHSFKLKS